ncbi:hypothetical protein GCM10023187_26940 [Nibrella viscosa]|uniref:Tetratricopeptide repeat-containing protein n=1 Tax=Nibrella viscosa TaxID=1084524 RepID=A0ABP8KI93_9BACT
MEMLLSALIIGFIIYLRIQADKEAGWEKEVDEYQEGIALFRSRQTDDALAYFNRKIAANPKSSIAYLYRARCYRALGNVAAAKEDLKTAGSYNETVPGIHLERGQIYFDEQNYDAAFAAFDKAVFHSFGTRADAFRWRGLARQQLGQAETARHDMDKAEAIAGQAHDANAPEADMSDPAFFNRRLLINAGMTILNSLILLFVIKRSPVIHWPYLLAASSAAGIGFIEPRKGWVLALLQVITLWGGYTFFTAPPDTNNEQELEWFNLYGTIMLTFAGSFVGGVLKRALDR